MTLFAGFLAPVTLHFEPLLLCKNDKKARYAFNITCFLCARRGNTFENYCSLKKGTLEMLFNGITKAKFYFGHLQKFLQQIPRWG